MSVYNFYVASILIINCHYSLTQRRIVNGYATTTDKNYVVYLTKADRSQVEYDNWICGGAIVTKEFIITSAACVEDVKFMYAIAGYHKYIKPNSKVFPVDECISSLKKKVVFTCLPQKYEFDYEQSSKWSFIDIAVVKVESPYDFKKPVDPFCSWIPKRIIISYDPNHSRPGTNAMVLGWGSTGKWRKPDDVKDYNTDFLHYAPVLISKKSDCLEGYKHSSLLNSIEKYMICTSQAGNINDRGEAINIPIPSNDGCGENSYEKPCEERYNGFYYPGFKTKRRDASILNDTTVNNTIDDIQNRKFNLRRFIHKGAPGICQNDHGGPLVTWVGTDEVLIGTASVFLVNNNNSCVGPFLFTSTQCSGAFLGCVLGKPSDENCTEADDVTRRLVPQWFNFNVCNIPGFKRGFEIIQRRISWMDHPDGYAFATFTT